MTGSSTKEMFGHTMRNDVQSINETYALQFPTLLISMFPLQLQGSQGRRTPVINPSGSPKYPSSQNSHRSPVEMNRIKEF